MTFCHLIHDFTLLFLLTSIMVMSCLMQLLYIKSMAELATWAGCHSPASAVYEYWLSILRILKSNRFRLSEVAMWNTSKTGIIENKSIVNMYKGTSKGHIVFPLCLFLHLHFPLHSSAPCALYIMLISVLQLDCYDEFYWAFICLW